MLRCRSRKSRAGKNRGHGTELAPPEFHRQHPAWREQAAGMRGNFAISIKTIRAAIERAARIVVADLRLQAGDLLARHIGWIGDENIHRPFEGVPVIARHERRTGIKTNRGGIVALAAKRGYAD